MRSCSWKRNLCHISGLLCVQFMIKQSHRYDLPLPQVPAGQLRSYYRENRHERLERSWVMIFYSSFFFFLYPFLYMLAILFHCKMQMCGRATTF